MGLFSKITIFSSLPSHIIQIFLRNAVLHDFSRNSLIYKQGDPSKSLFFIKDGQIEVFIIYLVFLISMGYFDRFRKTWRYIILRSSWQRSILNQSRRLSRSAKVSVRLKSIHLIQVLWINKPNVYQNL